VSVGFAFLTFVRWSGILRWPKATKLIFIGNHAQALALAARTAGIPAHIVMPTISPPPKIAATKGYGAHVVFSGSTAAEREAVAAQVIKDTGARLVPPYDHPDIILGQGTMGLELQEQVAAALEGAAGAKKRRLDAIIAPCGGGGMLSGVSLSASGTGIRVFGAEPSLDGADDARRGLAAGKRVTGVKTLTIADGLRTELSDLTFGVIREHTAGVFAVTEDEIRRALRLLLERMKVVVEPSAAVPLAAALYNEEFRTLVEREAGEEGWELGIVLSGGNIELEKLGSLLLSA
jgi:threonine dehydratase